MTITKGIVTIAGLAYPAEQEPPGPSRKRSVRHFRDGKWSRWIKDDHDIFTAFGPETAALSNPDIDHLVHIIASALPHVEEAIEDKCLNPSGKAAVRKLAREMRTAVEGSEALPTKPPVRTDYLYRVWRVDAIKDGSGSWDHNDRTTCGKVELPVAAIDCDHEPGCSWRRRDDRLLTTLIALGFLKGKPSEGEVESDAYPTFFINRKRDGKPVFELEQLAKPGDAVEEE
jgi:hypothetical protein